MAANFFSGTNLTGNIFYGDDGDGIILSGYDLDSTPSTNYICSGTNLKLTTSTFSGQPITYIDNLLGEIASTGTTYKAVDLRGQLDLSEASQLLGIGYGDAGGCFLGQSKLTDIIFPTSLNFLSKNALSGCTELTWIAFYNEVPSWMEYDAQADTGIDPSFISAVNDPESGTSFDACPLQTIYVPDDKVEAYHTYATTSTTCQQWFDDSTMTFKGLSEMPAESEPTHLSDIAILGISLGCGLGVPLLTTIILNAVTISKLNKQKKK